MAEASDSTVMEAEGVESFGYRQELKRSLSLVDLLIYGLVFIVPMAPVAVFGIVFNASHGMVPLIYAVGLVAMLFTAFSYMSMSRAFPVAGSVYAYASRSLGPTVGFFAGWAILLDYILLPTLNYVACAIAMHSTYPGVPKPVWVIALLAIATVVNYFGITTTARMNTVMLWLGVAILVTFTVVAFVALGHGVAGAHLSLVPLFNPHELTAPLIFGALSLAVLSFLGFDAISTLAEESAGGAKAVGTATILSLVLAAFLFVAQTYLASLFVLGRTSFPSGDPTTAAFYDICNAIGGYWLKFLLTVPGVVIGGLASALTAQAATARLIYGMARDGKLPKLLARVNEQHKVPDRAVMLVAIVTLIAGIFMVDQLELLTSMVNFGALLGFLLLHISVVAHFIWRQKSRDWLRHLVSPAIGFLIIGYVMWNAELNAKIAGLSWLAAGACLFVTLRLMGRSIELPTETH
jgi:amino acid transporter